jgi:hypothetical protein
VLTRKVTYQLNRADFRSGLRYWASALRAHIGILVNVTISKADKLIFAVTNNGDLVCAPAAHPYSRVTTQLPALVIPLATQPYLSLQQKLPYTGVTTGERQVALVRQPYKRPIATNQGHLRFEAGPSSCIITATWMKFELNP